jgi:hypothetical protein
MVLKIVIPNYIVLNFEDVLFQNDRGDTKYLVGLL